MGFQLEQKSMTLNVCCLCYLDCDQMTETRITQFRCIIALYLMFLHIKFDYKI